MIHTSFDVFTLGETMIRLTPKGFTRLEEAAELEVRIGGTESNVAIALARLGLNVAWASRLPRNPLGELVARRIRSFGVDICHVCWADGERMGLYFIEPGAAPRSGVILYDRAASAASAMTPEDFDWSVMDRVRHVHLTGITPALSDSARATTARAIAEARARSVTVSFDVNYRARLWSPESARDVLTPLVADVDLLISTESDAAIVFGFEGSPEELAIRAGGLTRAPLVALTLGGQGALLWDRTEFHRAEAFPVQAIDRVGAGDAFDAGLISGFLQGDAPEGIRRGMAMAAIKHTIPGDEWISSMAEVESLLGEGHGDIRR